METAVVLIENQLGILRELNLETYGRIWGLFWSWSVAFGVLGLAFGVLNCVARRDYWLVGYLVPMFGALVFIVVVVVNIPFWVSFIVSLPVAFVEVEYRTSSMPIIWLRMVIEMSDLAFERVSTTALFGIVSPIAWFMWFAITATGIWGFYLFLSPFYTVICASWALVMVAPAVWFRATEFLPYNAARVVMAAGLHMAMLTIAATIPLTTIEIAVDPQTGADYDTLFYILLSLISATTLLSVTGRVAAAVFHGSFTRGDHVLGPAINGVRQWLRK